MGPKYKIKTYLTGEDGGHINYTIVKRVWPFGYIQYYHHTCRIESWKPLYGTLEEAKEAVTQLNLYP